MQSLKYIERNVLNIGEAWLWANPGPVVTGDMIGLTMAPDSNGFIKLDRARPGTGDFLGLQAGGVTWDPGITIDFEKGKTGGSIQARSAIISVEADRVTAQLLWTGREATKKYFYPPGVNTASSHRWGGKSVLTGNRHSLLIINTFNEKPNLVECIYFFSGVFQPASFSFSGLSAHSPLPMTYYALAAEGATPGCLRPPGEQTGIKWYQLIDIRELDGLTITPNQVALDEVLAGYIYTP
jgi:hypothetical protein